MAVGPEEHFIIIDGSGAALNGVCANIEEAEASIDEIRQNFTGREIIIMRVTKTPVRSYVRSVDWTEQTVS